MSAARVTASALVAVACGLASAWLRFRPSTMIACALAFETIWGFPLIRQTPRAARLLLSLCPLRCVNVCCCFWCVVPKQWACAAVTLLILLLGAWGSFLRMSRVLLSPVQYPETFNFDPSRPWHPHKALVCPAATWI